MAIIKPNIKLIAGLGNPGAEYARTRHNAGAWFVQQLAANYRAVFHYERKFLGQVTQITVNKFPVWLLEPSCFMNLSGKSVLSISKFYKILPQQILIAHDELNYPAGITRFRFSGGHGGHNGLRDIMRCLGSKDFYRLRIGIGHPGCKKRVRSYVLSAPLKVSRNTIDHSFIPVFSVLSGIITGSFKGVIHASPTQPEAYQIINNEKKA